MSLRRPGRESSRPGRPHDIWPSSRLCGADPARNGCAGAIFGCVDQLPIALASGNGIWMFLLFLVVFFFAICHGYYTRTGSAINQRPYNGTSGDAPGAEIPARSAATSTVATTRAARAERAGPARDCG